MCYCFSTGSKFYPVSIFTYLHNLNLATCALLTHAGGISLVEWPTTKIEVVYDQTKGENSNVSAQVVLWM